jgi:hypothetical protein
MTNQTTDTVAKDFDSILESLITFASTEYGEQTSANRVWTDFNISSFSRNWAELVAYMGDQIMFYLDVQANQAYLETSTIPAYILRIAQQAGFNPPTQQASAGIVKFTTTGPYEILEGSTVFAGDTEFFTVRTIQGNLAEEATVEAIQGRRINQTFTSEGLQNEEFVLTEPQIIVDLENANPTLRSPIVRVNGVDYSVVTTPVTSSPVARIATRTLLSDGRTKLTFGDGIFGRRLTPNENIQVIYRVDGGSQGNVEEGEIDSIRPAIANVASVTNDVRFSGGVDPLTIRELKDRVPLSLKTTAGAISLSDYGDILEANFAQVLKAKSTINNTQDGVDIDVFVLPQNDEVTNITDNRLLFDTLTDFLERKKTVGTRFLIKNGEEILLLLELEVFLNRDASRSSVEADLRQRLQDLFDLRSGNPDGSGITFAQNVKLGDVFDVVKQIPEIERFEVKKFTVSPRVEVVKASVNQRFFVSPVDVFEGVGTNEWAVITDQLANPEPINGQVEYVVYKRTLATATSLTQDSISDSNLDLTVREGVGIVINQTRVTDTQNVFQLGEFNNFLLIDQNNNIWRINNTFSNALQVASPALNNAVITTVANGNYAIVRSFAGERVAVNGIDFTVLYNNKDTFFSPGSSFDIIATARTPFFLSEEQTNKGTYGVPVAITAVTPEGPNPGDLVRVEFNGNPTLQSVDDSFTLIDRTGELFEVAQVADDETPVASYFATANLNNNITLTDGAEAHVSMPFIAEKTVTETFIAIRLKAEKIDLPVGGLLVDLKEDDNGFPGALIQTSIVTPTATIPSNIGFNDIQVSFASEVTLEEGQKYHLVVYGDNAYKLSYDAGDGEVRIGTDSVNLNYFPATTAAGTARLLNNANVNASQSASTQLTVLDNNIRSRIQARNQITIISNDWTGANQITIAGVGFVEGSEFTAGATIEDSRDALLAAIQSDLVGVVVANALGTDRIELVAVAEGEAGNELTIEVDEASPQNFQILGDSFGGGLNGDKIVLEALKFANTTSVAFTYTSATGIVQYASSVSLPALEDGLVFIDANDQTFPITAIDDLNNRLTLAPHLTVAETGVSNFSGSIKGTFTLEFDGSTLVVGGDVDLTAENIKDLIETEVQAVSVVRTMNVLAITSDIEGEFGNSFTVTTEDLGTTNFEVSDFSGGQKSDVITIDGVPFGAVSNSPTPNQFIVGINANTTLNNLALQINNLGVATATVLGNLLTVSANTPGAAGNAITLEVEQAVEGTFELSGETLEGGQDNLRIAVSADNSSFSNFVPDSDLLFSIVVNEDSLLVVSKSDLQGNQVIPRTSVQNAVDSSIGKRYYSDNGEVSFLIATQTPNAFIVGADDANLFGRGTVGGNPNIRVDQFIFRTSPFEDDVTNLRDMEIPVLRDANVKINLLGGVS